MYRRGSFIEPHDDEAEKVIGGVRHRRTVALIYYLTKGWDESLGGSFVDLQARY